MHYVLHINIMNHLKNLIAATYSPMNLEGKVNLDIIPTYQAFLIKNKIAGAFVNGSTGDFVSLTTKERKLIIDKWASIKSDEFTLINHVGHTSLKVAKDLTRHSADKVDAIAALAPYYFKIPTLQLLVDYCFQIASCAPNKRFYYYHIPYLTGINFSMIDFLKLANDQIPNLAGIKFTTNNAVDYQCCKNFDNQAKNILFGVDEIFIESLALGAEGWVGSTYNHLAPLYFQIKKSFENNDMKIAVDLQTKSMQFVNTLNSHGGYNGAAKSFMKILGVDCGPSRFPHTTLQISDLQMVKKKLEDLKIMPHMNII